MDKHVDEEYYKFISSKYSNVGSDFNQEYFDYLISKYNYKDMVHDTFKKVIVPEFKNRGFRKNGNTFYRERDGLIEICNVQFSRYNHSTSASFTYNIEIAVPSFYDLLGIEYRNKLQATIFGDRLGTIALWSTGLSSNWDYWYTLEAASISPPAYSETENNEIVKIYKVIDELKGRYDIRTGEGFDNVVAQDIENIIIKFFKSILSAELLLKHIEGDEPNGIIDETMMLRVAELYYFNGEEDKGRNIFRKIRHGQYHVIIDKYIEEGEIVL